MEPEIDGAYELVLRRDTEADQVPWYWEDNLAREI